MTHMSIHERGLAVGRFQAGQSVSQVRPLFDFFLTFSSYIFSKGIFFSNMITTFKKTLISNR